MRAYELFFFGLLALIMCVFADIHGYSKASTELNKECRKNIILCKKIKEQAKEISRLRTFEKYNEALTRK